MIDSHHHFWRYNPVEYDWLDENMVALHRDFLPHDLKKEMDGAGVKGVVSVQALQTLEETRWLLEMADERNWILGVVGWAPLAAPNIESELEKLSTNKKLKAVRHVVQAEAEGFLDVSDFNRGIALLPRFDLAYDILIYEHQLAEAIRFVSRYPNHTFVLDHIAKPRIKDGEFDSWSILITELAKRENVFCKISGMVTEANWATWTPQGLKPYFETVLDAFGPSRLMFGSDWPVCLVASEYKLWMQTVLNWTGPLSSTEKAALFEETAREAYRLA
jgi:L-fuconolactonase